MKIVENPGHFRPLNKKKVFVIDFAPLRSSDKPSLCAKKDIFF